MANTSRIKLDDSAIENIAENRTLQNELNLSSDEITKILKNLNNNGAGKSSLFYIAFTKQKDETLTKIAKEIVKHLRVEKITENGEVIVLDKNNDELDITGITIKGNGKITYINGAKFLANQPSIPFIDKKETTGFNQLNVKFINSLIEFHETYPDKDMEICFVNEKNMDLSPHKKSAGEQSISNVLDGEFYFDESKNKNNYFFDKPIRVLPLINSLFNENNQLKKDFFEKNNLSSKRFDFFVENSLIEYDGIQHFVSKPGDFGSKTFFKDTIKRYSGDLAKNLFAYNSNIPLLRLPVELYPPEKYAEWEDRAEEYKRKITGVIVYFIKTGRVPENIIEYYEKYGGIAGKVYAKHARLINKKGFNINGENNGKSITAESIRELINSKTSGEKNEKIKNILKEPQNWTAGAYSELEKLALDEKDTILNLNDIINAVSKMEKIKKDDVVKTDKIEKDEDIDEAVEYLNALNKINGDIFLKRDKWSESQYEDKIFFNNNNNNNNNKNKISVKIERNGSGVLLDMIDDVVVPIKNAAATKDANAEKEALNRVMQFIKKWITLKKLKKFQNL